ncbi:MAG: hypothetical protein JRK53_03690 [Deltaproteobacteria bacterium]|nr:hypothetical protein [Deltaproteobacteria bacterium]
MVKAKHELKGYVAKLRSKHLIGTLSEKSLHSSLKDWYAQPGDRKEVQVDGFHIDIVRHNLLIEIQTANFSSQKRKLSALIQKHPLRLVLPIAQEKWIVRLEADGVTQIGRRKSPKKGNIFHLFGELVSIPDLIKHPKFSLEVLLIQEEEIRCDDGKGSRRRKGLSIMDHRLIGVVGQNLFREPSDFLSLIPIGMPEPFSTEELAEGIDQPRWLAQKMAYCLRNMGALDIVGKNGNSILYSISSPATRS